MDKLKKVKIEYEDGSLSDEIPFAVDAINVTMEDGKDLEEKVNEIFSEISYTPINITNFTNNIGVAEKGSTVNSITLNWSFNGVATELKLDSEVLTPSTRTKTITNAGLTSNKTYTLQAKDRKNASSTKTTAINFYNGVYYGVAGSVTIDDNFVRGLTKTLQSARAKTFSVTAGANQYIYYAIPASYGNPTFNVGGFEGGFSKVSTFDFTNASGFKESYNVYKSENANLGATTVIVS